MRTLLMTCALGGIITWLTGCATKTIVIDSQADVVRLGPGVRGPVYVWRDGGWRLTGRVTLPEGWYAGPGPLPK